MSAVHMPPIAAGSRRESVIEHTPAEMLGVQRSTVSLIAHSLQTAGLITQGRGVITITDRAGLEEVACECYGTIRRSFERLLPRTNATD